MSEHPHAYLPIDRRVALAAGAQLPADVHGTALEADLAGFTALTEGLAQDLGEQRGAEELAARLNVVYEALLTEVHRYGGTVLGFSGDAFTSWFDGDDGLRAVTCAQALQSALVGSPMRVKVALASGATRRFVVGDPAVQLLEGLAGRLVDELADAGHVAQPGEIVLAESTRVTLGDRVRTSAPGALLGVDAPADPVPWTLPAEDPSDLSVVRRWLLPAVHDRLRSGGGEFLAELRPATALFVRFTGVDFDSDPAALERLDEFVRAVQGVLAELEGTLVQLTIGDKGAYLYAAFGAPVAHEDDPTRALHAALRLLRLGGRDGLVDEVAIGVAAGRLRAGAYGATQRRTYGVLGDTVNLAARLMQAAAPGEVIATREVRAAAGPVFAWRDHDDLVVKGKSAPVAVAELRGLQDIAAELLERRDGELLGRGAELELLMAQLADCRTGTGGVVAVTGEAGVGKTRLVAEFAAAARATGLPVVRAECPSYGRGDSYVVWRPIWLRLLDLDSVPPERRPAALIARLAAVDETLVARAPLLAPLLGVELAHSELTAGLEAKVRKTALESAFAAVLRHVSEPLLLVLEDCHWIDALSEDLLLVLGRAIRDRPVLIVLTYRARDESDGGVLAVARLPHHRELSLGPLSDDDVTRLIDARLAAAAAPEALAGRVRELGPRAEGNPFYVQELVEYVLSIGPTAFDADRRDELPSSLQSLVLSRIDRLPDEPRSALRVASAIGRIFDVDLLAPVHPELGERAAVGRHVATLERGTFVRPERVPHFGFVHAVTQEVAYSTLPGVTRRRLHGRIGRLLEGGAPLELLAHHFGRGDDESRRRRYVLQAAKESQSRYALAAAIEHYRNVLDLLDGAERQDALLDLGRCSALTGDWASAAQSYRRAADEAAARGDRSAQGWAEVETGELWRKQGRYDEASTAFANAHALLDRSGDLAGVAEVLHDEATLAAQRGSLDAARERYAGSLDLRRELGDRRGTARALNGLGIVAEYEGDLASAIGLYREALEILVELGDAWGTAALTNNIGMTLLLQEQPAEARPHFEQAVTLQREVGDPLMLANFLSNLGDAARELDDLDSAERHYGESLSIAHDLGELWLIAYLLEDVALLAVARGLARAALELAAAGAALRVEIGAPLPAHSLTRLDERLAPARAKLPQSEVAAAAVVGARLSLTQSVGLARTVLVSAS